MLFSSFLSVCLPVTSAGRLPVCLAVRLSGCPAATPSFSPLTHSVPTASCARIQPCCGSGSTRVLLSPPVPTSAVAQTASCHPSCFPLALTFLRPHLTFRRKRGWGDGWVQAGAAFEVLNRTETTAWRRGPDGKDEAPPGGGRQAGLHKAALGAHRGRARWAREGQTLCSGSRQHVALGLALYSPLAPGLPTIQQPRLGAPSRRPHLPAPHQRARKEQPQPPGRAPGQAGGLTRTERVCLNLGNVVDR